MCVLQDTLGEGKEAKINGVFFSYVETNGLIIDTCQEIDKKIFNRIHEAL